MSDVACGTFEVKLAPQDTHAADELMARMTLDKVFHGDLEATSQGEMLAARTATEGSAGYVAMELVTGTLKGRTGSFVLQHSSTMTRGVPEQSVTVVPDSGTGELIGLSGRLTILMEGGKHGYEFEWDLAKGT